MASTNSSSLNIVKEWQLCPRLHKYKDVLGELNMHHEQFAIQFVTNREVVTGGFSNELYMMNVVDNDENKSNKLCELSVKATMFVNNFNNSNNNDGNSDT